MADTPNLKHIVQRIRDSRPWDFRTKAVLCEYGQAVVTALHQEDAGFGHLKKKLGQNQCPTPKPRAVDAVLYKPNGQIVDYIGSAGFGDPPPPNPVTWNLGPLHEYGDGDWFSPVEVEPPVPPAELEARVSELENDVMVLNTDVTKLKAETLDLKTDNAEIKNQIGILNDQLANLTNDMLTNLEAAGDTNRNWGHGHSAILKVRKKI